ncbi:MAG: glycerol-3-phosphate acyltransferase [Roseiflexus sp.]|nr:glycerol-3-phosphate acyltransferase [Roseiflexus sp.]MCS7290323.1 glycerol-3-phosphate acyltransferase [Roseiflexus sp.]MDW8146077.1 glycerol-3-phosphate acyltransferase [Roseiflexaceae bacterium]MDW8231261.1 glycerol-3-phosphate acyltransferase [Roseiflexaceae bacterium]
MLTIPHLALALIAYLVGAITLLSLVAWRRGVDLRIAGSGNVGAANVWRTCGFGAFVAAMSGDRLTGALPILAAQMLNLPPLAVATVGATAMPGHMRSVFLGFRSGKAVATSDGALLAWRRS